MAPPTSGYTTPPQRPSTPVVPDTPTKQHREIFPGALDNPRRVIRRSTQSDCGDSLSSCTTVCDDPFVGDHPSAAAFQRRRSSAGDGRDGSREGLPIGDFAASNKMTEAARSPSKKKSPDKSVTISLDNKEVRENWIKFQAGLHAQARILARANEKRLDEGMSSPHHDEESRQHPISPPSTPPNNPPACDAGHQDDKCPWSNDSGYFEPSPPHSQPGDHFADDEHTLVASSPECERFQTFKPAGVRVSGEPLRVSPLVEQQYFPPARGFPRNSAYPPGSLLPYASPVARQAHPDPLNLLKNGNTRTSPDKLQEQQRAFKEAQTKYPGRFALFVGNLTANYTDWELTSQLLYAFRHFDSRATVSVSREYSRSCIKPRAIVQMTNETSFTSALSFLNNTAIFPSDPRKIRVQPSTAPRHLTVVRRGDGLMPTFEEVVKAFEPFGVIDEVSLDLGKGRMQVRMECYGAFLAVLDCVRKDGSSLVLAAGGAGAGPRDGGRGKGKGKKSGEEK